MKNIVVVANSSPRGRAAARRAAMLAAATAARLFTFHLVPGSSVDDVARFAMANRADLVVVGQRGGFLEDLFGTGLARRLWQRVDMPVLAVARDPDGAYRRVLLATDFSSGAERAAAVVADWFVDSEVQMTHVCRPLYDGMLSAVSEPVRETHRSRALLDAVGEMQAFATRTRLRKVSLHVRIGSTVAGIRSRASSFGAELVVVGPRRKSWLERLLWASVSDALLAEAEHDLLIVGVKRDACGSIARDRLSRVG
jgi:nucleotide-binding universal stress UspA family protein